MAGAAYGVTMEEPCVSKIVSVKFHKVGEPPRQTATASLETPTSNPVDKEEDAPH